MAPPLIMTYYLDSVTLYCTLPHFSTLFSHIGPAYEPYKQGGVIYFTQYYTMPQDRSPPSLYSTVPSSLTACIYSMTVKYYMENINPMVSIAHVYVRDRNYTVSVTMNMSNRRLHIFKYSEDSVQCEYEIFDVYEEACEYLEHVLGSV